MPEINKIFNFKGQVKVSDIQAAFDELIGGINEIVNLYTTMDTFLDEQDYSVGGDSLGAAGYTLTIGGLKQVMAAYDGVVLGCRAFKISGNQIAITDGFLITKDKIFRVNSQILSGTGSVIYINTSTEQVSRGNDGDTIPEGCTALGYLIQVGDDIYLNCHRGVQLEGLPGYNITINASDMARGISGDDPNAHRFQGAGVYNVNSGGASRITFLDEVELASGQATNRKGAKHMHISCCPANFLFIPKGCSSPIYVKGSNHVSRTQYTLNLNKGESE